MTTNASDIPPVFGSIGFKSTPKLIRNSIGQACAWQACVLTGLPAVAAVIELQLRASNASYVYITSELPSVFEQQSMARLFDVPVCLFCRSSKDISGCGT